MDVVFLCSIPRAGNTLLGSIINQNKKIKHDLHIDLEDDFLKYKTAIFYLTTTNGFTTIGDKKVKDIKNRLVVFDGTIKHCANTQTDKTERLLININFI